MSIASFEDDDPLGSGVDLGWDLPRWGLTAHRGGPFEGSSVEVFHLFSPYWLVHTYYNKAYREVN
jgi:hypothetical protein